MPSLKMVKHQAWAFYSKWKKQKTFSPAFNSDVRVSLKGWYHITGARGFKQRSAGDVYRRLMILHHAKTIIETATTIQNVQVKGKITYYALDSVTQVSENDKTEWRKLRVIIIDDIKGNKVFYSVMDKKPSIRPKIQKKRMPHP